MNILLSLFLIVLIAGSSAYHAYFVWQRKDYQTLFVQMGIVGIAVIAGILVIYDVSDLSISRLLNLISPFDK